MAEIGNIVKAVHDGIPLFTDAEIEAVRVEIRELMEKPYEKQSAGLEKILSVQKEKMFNRFSAFNAETGGPHSGKDSRSRAPSMYEEKEPPDEPEEDYGEAGESLEDEPPPEEPAEDDPVFEDDIPEPEPPAKARNARTNSRPAAKDTFDIF